MVSFFQKIKLVTINRHETPLTPSSLQTAANDVKKKQLTSSILGLNSTNEFSEEPSRGSLEKPRIETLEKVIKKTKKQIIKELSISPITSKLKETPSYTKSDKRYNSISEFAATNGDIVSTTFPQIKPLNTTGKRPFRILAIDGGGVRGIIPASILKQLEVEAGVPISEMFDLVAGTSTGAILASMLVLPESPGSNKPKFTAADGVDLYLKKCPEIFKTSLYRKLRTLSGFAKAIYSSTYKREVLDEYVGDAKISDSLVDLIVPSFDIREGKPYFFKSSKARREGDRCDYKLVDVLEATSSAPTYFIPHKIEGHDAPSQFGYRSFVDGALTANSPALCALAEAYRNYGADPANTVLVSLGCGTNDVGVSHEDAKNWGILNWAPFFPNVMLSSSVNTVHYQLSHVVPPAHYFRIQTNLPYERTAIDNVDPSHLRWLADHGSSAASSCRSQLAHLAKILKDLKPIDGRRISTNVAHLVETPDSATITLPLLEKAFESPWSPTNFIYS